MKLLFFGDSVTDCGCSRKTGEFGEYGIGYVRRVHELLPEHTVVNSGVSGNRIRNLLDRYERDCRAHAPDVLSVLIGINDIWHQFNASEPVDLDGFRAGYRKLLENIRADLPQARVILMEPFVLPIPEDRRLWRPDLDAMLAIICGLAAEFNCELVPLDALFTAAAAATEGMEALAKDGVHPTPNGHELIATNWIKTFEGN